MKQDKLIRMAKEHSERMFNIVLERENRLKEKFAKKIAREEKKNARLL